MISSALTQALNVSVPDIIIQTGTNGSTATVVVAIVGVLGTLAAALIGPFVSARNDRTKLHREQRISVYEEFISSGNKAIKLARTAWSRVDDDSDEEELHAALLAIAKATDGMDSTMAKLEIIASEAVLNESKAVLKHLDDIWYRDTPDPETLVPLADNAMDRAIEAIRHDVGTSTMRKPGKLRRGWSGLKRLFMRKSRVSES